MASDRKKVPHPSLLEQLYLQCKQGSHIWRCNRIVVYRRLMRDLTASARNVFGLDGAGGKAGLTSCVNILSLLANLSLCANHHFTCVILYVLHRMHSRTITAGMPAIFYNIASLLLLDTLVFVDAFLKQKQKKISGGWAVFPAVRGPRWYSRMLASVVTLSPQDGPSVADMAQAGPGTCECDCGPAGETTQGWPGSATAEVEFILRPLEGSVSLDLFAPLGIVVLEGLNIPHNLFLRDSRHEPRQPP